jgi:type VI secretion system secreted protein VgrG
MAGKTRTILELRVGSLTESDVRVSRVRGREALSELFVFEVDFEPLGEDLVDLPSLIGTEAQLHLKNAVSDRFIHGLAESVSFAGVGTKRPRYRLRLVPRLALLGQTEDSRIFQQLSVPEVVKKVLDEWTVVHAFGARRQTAPGGLSANYAKREYCVQYRETDLAFVCRLLEEEGIGFCFDQVEGKHTLVLVDEPAAFQSMEGDAQLPFREHDSAEDDTEYVHASTRDLRVQTGKTTVRDFDFTRPAVLLEASAKAKADADLERYEFRLTYPDDGPLKRLSKARLEEERVPSDTTDGATNCLRLCPGLTFEITDVPDALFGGKLQLLEVVHEATWDTGSDAAHYGATFVAQQANSPWRPPRRTPRPRITGAQTGFVVGPAGEEIQTDKHARIQVQFHWDRLGKKDDKASCFMRVVQPWAGPGWGVLRLPRIGQEVVVRFLDGDPDRPVVVGAVYDGTNQPPITLPDNKTQSTLRSNSSPGGGGDNELRFEDAKGAEDVFLHAQKDENIVVENDKRQEIFGNETLAVDKDRTRTVGGNLSLSVGERDDSAISGNSTLTVTGSRSTQTGMSHDEEITGNQSLTVAGTETLSVGQQSDVTVGAAAALTVGGVYAVNVGALLNVAVGGARLEQVGGIRASAIGASAQLQVVKDASAKVGGDDLLTVAGALIQTAGKDVEETVSGKANISAGDPLDVLAQKLQLEAQQQLTINVGGQPMLQLSSSGVTLSGKSITFDGSQITTKGSSVAKTSGGGGGGADDAANKDDKEKPGSAEASWSTGKAEPNTDVTLNVKLTNVPDGKKGLITIHHAASGALVPGGKIECQSKGGKLVDKKTGKAPVFQFGSKQLPWDPWDKPYFFYKASVEYQGLRVQTPEDTSDGGKSLKVKYLHTCMGDSWADAGGLTTGAEASEISGILGAVPDSKAVKKLMSVPNPGFSDWAPSLKGIYCYHHGSHGTCEDRVDGTFIDVSDPSKGGVGDPPECPVGNWRSVVILSKQKKYKYLPLGDKEILDKTKFPEVPRYLAYLDCCLAGWEPSLGRAFVSRGTQYVIAFRRTVPDDDARAMARKFQKKWAQTYKLDPDKIRDLFFDVGTPYYKSMRPVLVSWRYEAIQSPDAGVIDRALADIGSVVDGADTAIGSLFK